MGYFSQHFRNVKNRKTVTPKTIESGPIYELRYKSDSANKTQYLVIALNIYPYTGNDKEKLLHCLDMDYLPPRELKKVVKETGGLQEMVVDNRGTTFLEMKTPDGRANIKFYNKRVKTLTRQIPNIYKTFKLDKISKVDICEYDFIRVLDPASIKKFGLSDED